MRCLFCLCCPCCKSESEQSRRVREAIEEAGGFPDREARRRRRDQGDPLTLSESSDCGQRGHSISDALERRMVVWIREVVCTAGRKPLARAAPNLGDDDYRDASAELCRAHTGMGVTEILRRTQGFSSLRIGDRWVTETNMPRGREEYFPLFDAALALLPRVRSAAVLELSREIVRQSVGAAALSSGGGSAFGSAPSGNGEPVDADAVAIAADVLILADRLLDLPCFMEYCRLSLRRVADEAQRAADMDVLGLATPLPWRRPSSRSGTSGSGSASSAGSSGSSSS